MRHARRAGSAALVRHSMLLGVLAFGAAVAAQVHPEAPAAAFDGLTFRGVGPAGMSGRIDDVAVYEKNLVIFYVAAATATGGLWKTIDNGTTWEVKVA